MELLSPSEPMKPDRWVPFHACSLLLSAKCLLGTFWPFLGSTPSQKDADAARDPSIAFFPKPARGRPLARYLTQTSPAREGYCRGWQARGSHQQPSCSLSFWSSHGIITRPHFFLFLLLSAAHKCDGFETSGLTAVAQIRPRALLKERQAGFLFPVPAHGPCPRHV